MALKDEKISSLHEELAEMDARVRELEKMLDQQRRELLTK